MQEAISRGWQLKDLIGTDLRKESTDAGLGTEKGNVVVKVDRTQQEGAIYQTRRSPTEKARQHQEDLHLSPCQTQHCDDS